MPLPVARRLVIKAREQQMLLRKESPLQPTELVRRPRRLVIRSRRSCDLDDGIFFDNDEGAEGR